MIRIHAAAYSGRSQEPLFLAAPNAMLRRCPPHPDRPRSLRIMAWLASRLLTLRLRSDSSVDVGQTDISSWRIKLTHGRRHVTTNLKELMNAANAAVPRITPAQAREMIAQGNTLVVDVREASTRTR